MSQIYDLSQVKRRNIQLIAFEDGLFDLLLGSIYMTLAVYPVTRELLGPILNLVLYLGWLALLVVGQLLIRHLVSEPRIGYVRLRKTLTMRLLFIITVGMVLVTFGLVLVTLLSPGLGSASDVTFTPNPDRSYLVELITLLVLGAFFSTLGYLFGVRRLYFYGWMVGLAYLISVYMEHNAGWIFFFPQAIAAGIILVIGFVLLFRFLQNYPLHEEEY